MIKPLVVVLLLAASVEVQPPDLHPDAPVECAACDEWNREVKPSRVFGNTYSVGVAGLSSVLIASEGA